MLCKLPMQPTTQLDTIQTLKAESSGAAQTLRLSVHGIVVMVMQPGLATDASVDPRLSVGY